MGQLADALLSAGHQIEARLAAHRDERSRKDLYRVFPQSWRFETEAESAVLRIDKNGHISVGTDVIEPPAVIVRWTQGLLTRALFSGRSNERPRSPSPVVRFTSDTGRKAFSLLGTSLGL